MHQQHDIGAMSFNNGLERLDFHTLQRMAQCFPKRGFAYINACCIANPTRVF